MNDHQSVDRMDTDRTETQSLVGNRAYRFTIFIPTFNRSHTLDRALGSAAAQTHRDFEVLIIDDGSDLEIVKRYNISGEKRNALRTDVLRQYPYPIFDGERFIRDDLIWKRMARRFKLRCFNEAVQIIDHQADGLSSNAISNRLKNPKGFRYYFLEEINQYSSLTGRYIRFKYHSKFVRYSLHCKIGLRQQYAEVRSRFYWIISVPRGIIGWLEDKIRMTLKAY